MPRAPRALTATGLLLVAVLGLAATPAQAHDETPASTQDLVLQARPSDSVVDGYGVGIHLGYVGTPYDQVDKVAAAINDLGVRHLRNDLTLKTVQQYQAMQTVFEDTGARFDLIAGRPGQGTPADYVRTVAEGKFPTAAVESLEGANEWDLFSNSADWAGEVRDWQHRLYVAAKAEPATADLPVLSPALAFRWNYSSLGDVSADSDAANAHMYPGGYEPSNEIRAMTDAVRTSVPDGPLITTESGYHNATASAGSHPGVPENVAAAYFPRLLLDHLWLGEQRVYSYELVDELDDPDLTNPEAHFGLLRSDWSPKPAYTAMKNLLALLADPGPAFAPGTLHVTLSGLPDDGYYLLTQKRDGSFVLLLWREGQTARLWDPKTQQPQTVAPVDVTLGLPETADVEVLRPTEGSLQAETTSAVTVPLDGQVTAVQIKLADTLPPPTVPEAPTVKASSPVRHRVVVRWQAADPNGSPVTAYRVTVAGRTRTLGPDLRRTVFRRLPSRRVGVTVSALNVVGWGPATHTRVLVR